MPKCDGTALRPELLDRRCTRFKRLLCRWKVHYHEKHIIRARYCQRLPCGSVLDKTYSTNKLVATDRDGPTGRVKFGTEGTNGLDTVTIRDIVFDRSRGFALETVDGAELKNILFTDIRMTNISSSPIFIDLADRGRAPVTGIGTGQEVTPRQQCSLD